MLHAGVGTGVFVYTGDDRRCPHIEKLRFHAVKPAPLQGAGLTLARVIYSGEAVHPRARVSSLHSISITFRSNHVLPPFARRQRAFKRLWARNPAAAVRWRLSIEPVIQPGTTVRALRMSANIVAPEPGGWLLSALVNTICHGAGYPSTRAERILDKSPKDCDPP